MRKPMIKRKIDAEISMTPEEVAQAWCDLDSEGQAQFFEAIYQITQRWDRALCFQLQAVTDEPLLSLEGRSVMRDIGEYADKEFVA